MSEFSSSAVNIAPVKWAQRKDSLYITISLADVKDHKIELTEKKLTFTGSSSGKLYSLDLEFLKAVETEGSVWNVLPASIQMKIIKKEKDEEFWPRLLLDKVQEKTNVKIDWDRYVDEDEADGKDFDTGALDGGMDFGGLGGGAGGFGGAGGMDFSKFGGGLDDDALGGGDDSDDDEGLPDLETAEDAPSSN